MHKVGFGYDIHKLVEGRKLILGGVEIPHRLGLLGHSDGDVLIHSIIDALLGALSLGDIGEYFPDNDEKYKDISSTILLKEVAKILKRKKVKISNIDITIIIERPKLTDYKKEIKKSIARILEINKDKINIKAKTNEKIGNIGKEKAIVSFAVVCLC